MEYSSRESIYLIDLSFHRQQRSGGNFVAAATPLSRGLDTNEALDNANAQANQGQANEEQQQRIITDHGNNLTSPTHSRSEQFTDHLNESRDGKTSSSFLTATLLSQ